MVSGHRVISVSLGSYALGIGTSYFRAGIDAQVVPFSKSLGVVELSSQEPRCVIARHLGYRTVDSFRIEISLKWPVLKSGEGVFAVDILGDVSVVGKGGKSGEVKTFEYIDRGVSKDAECR